MKILHLPTVDSTHLYAKKHLLAFINSPITIITTDFQTNGIGSRKDQWLAPLKSSLLMTVIYPTPSKEFIPYLSKICALSLKKTLSFLPIEITFKYPNDLMVNGRKLAGFLSEICNSHSLLSTGLNLLQTKDDLALIDQPATSLFIETGEKINQEDIIKPYLENFTNYFSLS